VTSSTDITNRALQAIGTRSTIASMTEGSNESNNASLCYAATRQEIIRGAPWNFATATAALTLIKSAPGTVETPLYPVSGVWSNSYPPPGWLFEYGYPADCLRARKLVCNYSTPAGTTPPLFPFGTGAALAFWDLPGQRFQVTADLDVNGNPFTCILANTAAAILCYLRDITIEDIWDAMFTEAMVYALAGKLALALTGAAETAKMMFDKANEAIAAARAADANEGFTVMDHMPEWITRAHGIAWMSPGTIGGYCLPYGGLF